MSARIYIEGGGDSKELHIRCRAGFRQLLESCGFAGRMPKLISCGGRGAVFDDFMIAQANASDGEYIAMLIDSEEPLANIDQTWAHLIKRDGWKQAPRADDDQVLLMTTCMETWIVADRQALRDHYGPTLQEANLPDQNNLESRARDAIYNALVQATRNCKNRYAKGKRSFEILAKLNPAVLRQQLPSFARCDRILGHKL